MEVGRADARITAVLGGQPIPGEFDSFEGGDTTMSVRKYRNGGRGKQKARPGQKTTEDFTVTRGFDPVVDDTQFYRDRAGRPFEAHVAWYVPGTKTLSGKVDVWPGILAGIVEPKPDSDSDEETATIGLVGGADEK